MKFIVIPLIRRQTRQIIVLEEFVGGIEGASGFQIFDDPLEVAVIVQEPLRPGRQRPGRPLSS